MTREKPPTEESLSAHAPVLALVADLIFASRIRGAAAAASTEACVSSRAEEVLAWARAAAPRLVLVDLNAAAADPPALIARLKESGAAELRVVAFASHTDKSAIEAARRAGADRVLARSAFLQALPKLLAEARGHGEARPGEE
ncbi:MAG: response regulator transcription factor [Gemmatimonadetes bacterium]|nr:response regulator transcription factor [Gemmatimonadota bacterium]